MVDGQLLVIRGSWFLIREVWCCRYS